MLSIQAALTRVYPDLIVREGRRSMKVEVFKKDELPQALGLQMHHLRKKAFLDRRKWNVQAPDGLEIDCFDQMSPIYFLVVQRNRVVASLRLLPTTAPYMLNTVFPMLLNGVAAPSSPHVYEVSRFCADISNSRTSKSNGVSLITLKLLQRLFEWSGQNNITELIGVHDQLMKRILTRSGCAPVSFGEEVSMDRGLRTSVSRFSVDAKVISRLTQAVDGMGEFSPS